MFTRDLQLKTDLKIVIFIGRIIQRKRYKILYFCIENYFKPENDTMDPIFCLDVKVIGKVIGLFREI